MRYRDLRWIILALLFPLMLLGLYGLGVELHSMARYDPAYFTAELRARYARPGNVALALEDGLQTGNRALLAELQGRSNPAAFQTNPYVDLVMQIDRTDRFLTYLYLDVRTYEQHNYHLEKVNGRYVAMAPDAYYYLYSGRWQLVFIIASIAWWLLALIVILSVWISRLSARLRQQRYPGP